MNNEITVPVLVEQLDGFDIYFTGLIEDIDPAHALDTDLHANAICKIYAHNMEWFCAKVSAHKAGIELGSDCLGCCAYDNFEDFYAKYHDDYFSDMARNAVEEAKAKLAELCQ